MLNVELKYPGKVNVYRLENWYYTSPNTGQSTSFLNAVHNIVVGTHSSSGSYEADVYALISEPSEVHGCNNCIHWDVDGHLTGESNAWYELGAPYDQDRNLVPHRNCTIRAEDQAHSITRVLTVLSLSQSGDIPETVWTHRDWWDGREIYTLHHIRTEIVNPEETSLENLQLRISGYETLTWESHPDWAAKSAPFEQIIILRRTSDSWWETKGYIPDLPTLVKFPVYHWQFGERNRHLIDDIKWRADREYSYGDATDDAAESIRLVNINSIAYLKDFAEIGMLAKSIVGLAGKVYRPLGLIGKAAQAYLTIHYGYKLTVQDTLEIANAVDTYQFSERTQTMGASKTIQVDLPGSYGERPVSVSTRMTGVVDYFSGGQRFFLDKCAHAKRALYELDLAPSAANLWDMVPLSFVGDWFVPLGDAFEDLELHDYEQTLGVHRAFYSRQIHWSEPVEIPVDGITFTGSVSCRYYERNCRNSLIIPPVRVDRPKGLSGHWIEAAALVFGKLK